MTHSVGVRQQQQSLSLWTTMPCWQAKAPGAPISEWWKRGACFLFEGPRYFFVSWLDILWQIDTVHIDIPFCPSTGYTWHLYLFIYSAWLVTDELQLHIGFLFWSQSLVLRPRPFWKRFDWRAYLGILQVPKQLYKYPNYQLLSLEVVFVFVLGNESHMGSHIHT